MCKLDCLHFKFLGEGGAGYLLQLCPLIGPPWMNGGLRQHAKWCHIPPLGSGTWLVVSLHIFGVPTYYVIGRTYTNQQPLGKCRYQKDGCLLTARAIITGGRQLVPPTIFVAMPSGTLYTGHFIPSHYHFNSGSSIKGLYNIFLAAH